MLSTTMVRKRSQVYRFPRKSVVNAVVYIIAKAMFLTLFFENQVFLQKPIDSF
jgi:hypothetical protein